MGNELNHRAERDTARHPIMMTAVVEMGADGHYRVRLRSGELVRAQCDDGVCPTLVAACIRERRRMIVEREGECLYIVGALQTQLTPSVASDANHPARLDLVAEQELNLRAGNSTLTLRNDGRVILRGNHLTMDIARLVKLLSAKVELP